MSTTPSTTWLPAAFAHPTHVEVGLGHHLRPIRADDVDLDMIAVMGSRERLWSIYGDAWGWPPATMTHEQDREDLARHAAEMVDPRVLQLRAPRHRRDGPAGVRLHRPPGEGRGADAEISWWVVDECVGTDLEAALDALVPRWIAEAWPLERPRYVGRDLSWADWASLPDLPR